jgi:hypothetical protein
MRCRILSVGFLDEYTNSPYMAEALCYHRYCYHTCWTGLGYLAVLPGHEYAESWWLRNSNIGCVYHKSLPDDLICYIVVVSLVALQSHCTRNKPYDFSLIRGIFFAGIHLGCPTWRSNLIFCIRGYSLRWASVVVALVCRIETSESFG